MKKLLLIVIAFLSISCSDGNNNRSDDRDNTGRHEREAAAEGDLDEGAGEAISPQLELDSAEDRFEVDTISSSEEAKKESSEDSF